MGKAGKKRRGLVPFDEKTTEYLYEIKIREGLERIYDWVHSSQENFDFLFEELDDWFLRNFFRRGLADADEHGLRPAED